MRYFSLAMLCLMAISLTACAGRTQQRQNELATADLQITATDLNYRVEMLEQRLTTVNNELSVLKNHPYPVKTTKGAKTNFIASAPSMPSPSPYAAYAPAPSSMSAPGAVPPSQQQGDGWLSSAPPPLSARGSGAKAVPAPSAQAPKPQSQPQGMPAQQSRHPASVNELALPPEMPAAPQQPAMTPHPPAAPQAASAPAPRGGRQTALPTPQSAAGQSEEAIYNKALAEFNAGRYAQAAAGFAELMYTYPAGRYAPNAGYWLGESLYGQNQDSDALVQFKEVTSRFPQHHKAPDALFKAGLCYMRLGDRDNAALQFRALVTDYPNSPAANLARQRGVVR